MNALPVPRCLYLRIDIYSIYIFLFLFFCSYIVLILMKYVWNDKDFTFNPNIRGMVYQSTRITNPFNNALQGRISI